MASINRKPATTTFEGGKAVKRPPKQELFLLCAAFLNEDSFYRNAEQQRKRIDQLAEQVCEDHEWALNLVAWLRGPGGLRTVAQIAASAIVHARLDKHLEGHNRAIIAAGIQRADEGPALLNYYTTTYGNLPKPVKRGVADKLGELTQNAWLKWNGKTKRGGITLTDAIRLTHPKPANDTTRSLFDLITRMHTDEQRAQLVDELPVIAAREQFNALTAEQRISLLTGPDAERTIRDARLTHELIFSGLGKLDTKTASAIWTRLLPDMGYQATLMNLRRIIGTAGEDSEAARIALDRISHPEDAHYEPLPIAFLSAYRNVPEIARPALEHAAKHSLRHVPELAGSTLVMLDHSGSMSSMLSRRSTLTRYDAASMFACALALKNPDTRIIPFENDAMPEIHVEGDDPLAMLDRFGEPWGGTRVGSSTRQAYDAHPGFTRVIVLTDEQTSWGDDIPVGDAVPKDVPLYVWNMDGYSASLSLGDRTRLNLGGLSDAAFTVLAFDQTTKWPWD